MTFENVDLAVRNFELFTLLNNTFDHSTGTVQKGKDAECASILTKASQILNNPNIKNKKKTELTEKEKDAVKTAYLAIALLEKNGYIPKTHSLQSPQDNQNTLQTTPITIASYAYIPEKISIHTEWKGKPLLLSPQTIEDALNTNTSPEPPVSTPLSPIQSPPEKVYQTKSYEVWQQWLRELRPDELKSLADSYHSTLSDTTLTTEALVNFETLSPEVQAEFFTWISSLKPSDVPNIPKAKLNNRPPMPLKAAREEPVFNIPIKPLDDRVIPRVETDSETHKIVGDDAETGETSSSESTPEKPKAPPRGTLPEVKQRDLREGREPLRHVDRKAEKPVEVPTEIKTPEDKTASKTKPTPPPRGTLPEVKQRDLREGREPLRHVDTKAGKPVETSTDTITPEAKPVDAPTAIKTPAEIAKAKEEADALEKKKKEDAEKDNKVRGGSFFASGTNQEVVDKALEYLKDHPGAILDYTPKGDTPEERAKNLEEFQRLFKAQSRPEQQKTVFFKNDKNESVAVSDNKTPKPPAPESKKKEADKIDPQTDKKEPQKNDKKPQQKTQPIKPEASDATKKAALNTETFGEPAKLKAAYETLRKAPELKTPLSTTPNTTDKKQLVDIDKDLHSLQEMIPPSEASVRATQLREAHALVLNHLEQEKKTLKASIDSPQTTPINS